jgi:uncharacterized protein YndB with AHSA1/START domain
MSQQTTEIVIRKSVHVSAPPEHAFRVFTEQINTWWPLRTHAVDPESAETVILEGREGGRLFERTTAGEEHVWGTVVAWDPPRKLGYTWHPGREEETAQEVSLTFTPEAGGTRVDLRHSGWEKLGDRMLATVGEYDEGWDLVISLYAKTANG